MVQQQYIYQYVHVDIFILYNNVITHKPLKCEYHSVGKMLVNACQCQFPEILKKNLATGELKIYIIIINSAC